jgi:hypothetical protein
MSFLDSLTNYVWLNRVLKILGIALIVVGFLVGWSEIRWYVKLLFAFGGAMFYVGLRYNAIYKKTP